MQAAVRKQLDAVWWKDADAAAGAHIDIAWTSGAASNPIASGTLDASSVPLNIDGVTVGVLTIHAAVKPAGSALSLLRFMAAALCRVVKGEPPMEIARAGAESRNQQVVHRTVDLIREHYERPLTLATCARDAGLSSVYFCTLFGRLTGVPFKTYLTQVRMDRAKELLADPATRVSEVAAAVGYRDANRFRQAFKSATGVAPSVWRER